MVKKSHTYRTEVLPRWTCQAWRSSPNSTRHDYLPSHLYLLHTVYGLWLLSTLWIEEWISIFFVQILFKWLLQVTELITERKCNQSLVVAINLLHKWVSSWMTSWGQQIGTVLGSRKIKINVAFRCFTMELKLMNNNSIPLSAFVHRFKGLFIVTCTN